MSDDYLGDYPGEFDDDPDFDDEQEKKMKPYTKAPQVRGRQRPEPPRDPMLTANGNPMYTVRAPINIGEDAEGDSRTKWVECGIAFGNFGDRHDGIKVIINALPLQSKWDGSLVLWPIVAKEE